MTISNTHIAISLTSCLKDTGYTFQISDWTIDIFLNGVKAKMTKNSCLTDDSFWEIIAFFDANQEMYMKIEHICKSSYGTPSSDFARTIFSKTQLVKEFINGRTVLKAGIGFLDQYATSHLLTWLKHHALDQCGVGATMCCSLISGVVVILC